MTKTSTIAGQVITLYKTRHGWASSPELAQAINDRQDATITELRASFQRDRYMHSREMRGNNVWDFKLGIHPEPYPVRWGR